MKITAQKTITVIINQTSNTASYLLDPDGILLMTSLIISLAKSV